MRVARGGYRTAAPVFILAIPAAFIAFPLGLGLFVLGVGILTFYRDPERTPPGFGIVSPADGRVSVIRREGNRIRVGVFMNVTNVHVNRAPLAGQIESIHHRPGAHRPAFSKDSDRNERVDLTVVGENESIDVSLIAGTLARRITPYVASGDRVDQGERIGHIAFGSRVDVLLPPSIDAGALAVEPGDRLRAGESPIVQASIGDQNGDSPDRE